MAGSARPIVTVVGSYAVGMTLRTDRIPVPGETRHGSDFDLGPGGKGSNQAIQAARLGADVELITSIGRDRFGDEALAMYAQEGVGTRHLRRVDRSTGVGFIILDAAGQNVIVLDMGANHELRPDHVESAADRIAASGAVLTQLEVPLDCALTALRLGRAAGVLTILNPAPARPIPAADLAGIDIVTPNHGELRILQGLPADAPGDDVELCRRLLSAGVGTVVLTRGEQGALIVRPDGELAVPSHRVEVVDSTGAGDAFSGTLATSLAAGLTLEAAARRAAAAGALACTRLGVVPSLATADAIDALAAAG
jgi:ribokinase